MVQIGKLKGIGVHTGKVCEVVFYTSKREKGIYIKDKDNLFEYSQWELKGETGQTNLHLPTNRIIKGVEHLLSSIIVHNPESLIIEINGEEVPIMDGSAIMFYNIIEKIPSIPHNTIEIKEKVRIEKEGKGITLLPSDYSAIVIKQREYPLNKEFVKTQILPARTYGNLEFYKFMKKNNLAIGSSLSNALLITDKGFYNTPRFSDEPERHKILDFIGDVIPYSYWIKGKIIIKKGGHSLFEECRHYIRSLI